MPNNKIKLSSSGKPIKKPDMPIGIFIQEAENLYHWCKDDKMELNRLGISDDFIELLIPLTKELSEAEAEFHVIKKSKNKLQEELTNLKNEAKELRSYILHILKFYFREDKQMLKNLRRFTKSESYPSLTQDLSDLAIFIKDKVKKNEITNDLYSKIERVSFLASHLGNVLATKNADQKNLIIKKRRDQAYSDLKVVVDEIRTVGKFLFDHDSERYHGYCSEYRKDRNVRLVNLKKMTS